MLGKPTLNLLNQFLGLGRTHKQEPAPVRRARNHKLWPLTADKKHLAVGHPAGRGHHTAAHDTAETASSMHLKYSAGFLKGWIVGVVVPMQSG